jgi:hypothetical protein
MIGTPLQPLTRQLRVALVCSAAVLSLPTPGFAGPIRLSNLAGATGRGIQAIFNGRSSRGGSVDVADNSSAGSTTSRRDRNSRGDLDVSDHFVGAFLHVLLVVAIVLFVVGLQNGTDVSGHTT